MRLPHAFTYVAHARASDAACGHTQRDCRDKVTVNNGQVADRVSRCLSCASSLACTHACPCGGVGRVCGHTQRLGRLRDALRTVRPGPLSAGCWVWHPIREQENTYGAGRVTRCARALDAAGGQRQRRLRASVVCSSSQALRAIPDCIETPDCIEKRERAPSSFSPFSLSTLFLFFSFLVCSAREGERERGRQGEC